MRSLLLILLLLAQPASGNGCHDLWFTRNLVMDRAGYCFGSTLGQAVFDNRGCIGTSISLDPGARQFVDYLQSLEAQHQCSVDTDSPFLDLPDAFVRRQLIDLPIADEFESACIGWQAPPVLLRAGWNMAAPVIGRIEPGDWVGFGHIPAGDWSYVTVAGPGWALRGGGWLAPGIANESSCQQWVG